MGVIKYIEHVKSIVLFLLVISSVILTFVIWTYTPDYTSIEQTTNNTTVIGTKKNIESVVKPYRMLYYQNDEFTGTTLPKYMDSALSSFRNWKDIEIERAPDITPMRLNELKRENNRVTIDFAGAVPFGSFNKIFIGSDNELPETTFQSIIIDWKSYKENRLQLFFISAGQTVVYRGVVTLTDGNAFYTSVVEGAHKLPVYREIERTASRSLYVPEKPIRALQYTYYIDEVSTEAFKNILFTKPSIVQRNGDDSSHQKYTDGMGLMTLDANRKSLNFVYPAAGTRALISATDLLDRSFEFINEHGGMTADYRLTSVAPETSRVDYQLFMQGNPVFSEDIATTISTTWGQKRIFRYNRPYYKLDKDFTSEDDVMTLEDGPSMVQHIQQYKGILFSDIEELLVGYHLTRDEHKKIFILTPSWYVKVHDDWLRVAHDEVGGDFIGLE